MKTRTYNTVYDWLGEDATPKISIGLLTFNHEKYIKKALCSVLEQVCSEPVELIIHDDCSTDETRQIIESMLPSHAPNVRRLYNTENQHSQNIKIGIIPFLHAKGQYITVLDGDDFWSGDIYRLEKMSRAMDQEPEIAFCFTDVKKFDNNTPNERLPHLPQAMKRNVPSYDLSILNYSFIHIGASLFRNVVKHFPDHFYLQHHGDTFLPLIWSEFGYAKFIEDAGELNYRIHQKGIYNGQSDQKKIIQRLIFACQVTSYLLEKGNLEGAVYQSWRFEPLINAYEKTKFKKQRDAQNS